MNTILIIVLSQVVVLSLGFTLLYYKLQQTVDNTEKRLMLDIQNVHMRINNLAKAFNLTDRPPVWQDGFRVIADQQITIDKGVGFLK